MRVRVVCRVGIGHQVLSSSDHTPRQTNMDKQRALKDREPHPTRHNGKTRCCYNGHNSCLVSGELLHRDRV